MASETPFPTFPMNKILYESLVLIPLLASTKAPIPCTKTLKHSQAAESSVLSVAGLYKSPGTKHGILKFGQAAEL